MDQIEDSPLLTKINAKLKELGDTAHEIRVSITAEAENFESNDGTSSYVKWLCWEINDVNENQLFQSDLAFIHGNLAQGIIEGDLLRFFPENRITVDNEIYFEE